MIKKTNKKRKKRIEEEERGREGTNERKKSSIMKVNGRSGGDGIFKLLRSPGINSASP